jgi:hypothetical protein
LFEKDGNKIYVIAQFYPRMFIMMLRVAKHAVLGSGEFVLPFGN